jgi:CheY-like chemotaxis protein
MTLKFKILWFEDRSEVVKPVRARLSQYLDKLGFELELEHHLHGNELGSLLEQRFDLILTDVNLAEGSVGDEIVHRIRDNDIYTDVLLYSVHDSALGPILDKHKLLERVSWCTSSELFEKTKSLIDLGLRRVQDLSNMRGLVVAEAIELESQITEVLSSFFSAVEKEGDNPGKELLMKGIYDKRVDGVQEQLKVLKEDYNHLKLVEVIESDTLFSISNVVDGLQSILKADLKETNKKLNGKQGNSPTLSNHKTRCENLKEGLSSFRKEVIDVRNTLAHVKEIVSTDGTIILQSRKKTGEPLPFTPEKCSEIRNCLRQHKAKIAVLREHLEQAGRV